MRNGPTLQLAVALVLSTLGAPLAANAQPPALPAIGYLIAAGLPNVSAGFRQGLSEAGCVEGQTVVIEHRSAEGRYERLAALAAELVSRRVAVIVAAGGNAPALAAKAATGKIPIVFLTGGDPVRAGLVASLNRPGVVRRLGYLGAAGSMDLSSQALRQGLRDLGYVEGQTTAVVGFLAYGPSLPDLSRRAALYVDQILKGARPGELPIEQPIKFELAVNLKVAETLRLTVPQSVLLQADEVIQ